MHILSIRVSVVSSFLALGVLAALPAGAQGLAPTVPVEVFAGKMEFADELRLPDQELAGVRLGVDLASYVGIRGYYWRALNDERDGWAPLQSYGAEAQLNLNAGNGITPFLVGGIGRVDFMEGFTDLDSVQPEDRNAFIAGGGLRLDVGRVGLVAAARSYLFEQDAESGDDLLSNMQYTAGIAFRLGRTGRRAQTAAAPPRIVRETPDTVYVARDPAGRAERDEEGQTFVTIPVPREGEIYLRYGPADSSSRRPQAGAPSEAELEAIRARLVADLQPVLRQLLEGERAEIREMIREELERMPTAGLTAEGEQRLLDNLEARLALRLRDEMGRPLVVDSTGAVLVARPAERRGRGFDPYPREWRPYLGANVDSPTQFVLGVRTDLGPFDAARPELRLVPEASIGVGHGTASVLIGANAQYDFSSLDLVGRTVEPYVYAGAGVLFFGDPPTGRAKAEAVVNAGYGFSAQVPGRSGSRFFLEHQGVDLFDLNRVLVGLRF